MATKIILTYSNTAGGEQLILQHFDTLKLKGEFNLPQGHVSKSNPVALTFETKSGKVEGTWADTHALHRSHAPNLFALLPEGMENGSRVPVTITGAVPAAPFRKAYCPGQSGGKTVEI